MARYVNRWRAQLGLEPVSGLRLIAAIKEGEGVLGPFLWFELSQEQRGGQALLGAMFIDVQRIVILKLSASPQVVAAQREAFLDFARSLSPAR